MSCRPCPSKGQHPASKAPGTDSSGTETSWTSWSKVGSSRNRESDSENEIIIELGDFKIPTSPKEEPCETKKDEEEKAEIRTEDDVKLIWGASYARAFQGYENSLALQSQRAN